MDRMRPCEGCDGSSTLPRNAIGEVQGTAIRTVSKTVAPQGACGFESHPLRI